MTKKAIMYGGGNIGRGFIGQLLYQSGFDVSFIDVNKELIDNINSAKEYPVRILHGEDYDEIIVKNVNAIDGNDIEAVSSAISNADVCATAVGVNVLKHVARPFKEGIVKRFTTGSKTPLNIIICENLIGADEFLRNMIYELMTEDERKYLDNVGFVEASIGRMVPIQTDEMKDGNSLRVCVESYDKLPVDSAAFRGEIPQIKNLVPFTPFSYYIERKLFIHNMGHAGSAYLGNYIGAGYIWESIENPYVELIVMRAMQESAMAMSKKYKVEFEVLNAHIEDLIYRFSNRQLGDTAARVGGDIKRKLMPNDRLVGAYKMCKNGEISNIYIAVLIAASLLFTREGEEKLSPDQIICEISGFSKDSDDYKTFMEIYKLFEKKTPLADILKKVKKNSNTKMAV